MFWSLSVKCQAAAVRILLCFFRLDILALEIGERYVQRLVRDPDWMFIDAVSANFRLAEDPSRIVAFAGM
jgi:hypothetical protein